MSKKVVSFSKDFSKRCILLQVFGYWNKYENDFSVLSLYILEDSTIQRNFTEKFLSEMLVCWSEIYALRAVTNTRA